MLLLLRSVMPDYSVFGGCLRSDLTFPDLTHAHDRTPNWMLRLGKLSKNGDADVLSDAELSPTCRIRLIRGDGWFRYSHSCTGSFEVFAEGRRILFERSAHGDLNGARADFVSRVLPYCVDHASLTWLNGSAVRIAGTAVAFQGPMERKSIIALALTHGGAGHTCEDTLPRSGCRLSARAPEVGAPPQLLLALTNKGQHPFCV